jgi:hypothetical protein
LIKKIESKLQYDLESYFEEEYNVRDFKIPGTRSTIFGKREVINKKELASGRITHNWKGIPNPPEKFFPK